MLELQKAMKGLLLAVLFHAAASMPAAAQAKPPLKLGGCFSVTGAASSAGVGAARTVQMLVEATNAAGGIDGRKIEFTTYDDESDATRGNTVVKRLIELDKVHAIIGCTTTGVTMAVIPLAERAGIPLVSLGAGSVITEPVKKFIFKTIQTDAMVLSRLYDHMLSRGIKSIGVMAPTDGFGRSCMSAAEKLAPGKGIKIARSESYNPKDTDMTVQLTKLRQVPDLQAILHCGFGEASAIVINNYKQLGITLPHYATHGLASQGFLALTGNAAEEMLMASAPILVWDQLPAGDPQLAVVQSYVKAYRAKFKEDPSYFAGTARDAFVAITQAVQRSGSIDPSKIRDALEKGNDFVGVVGVFRMTESDHVGLVPESMRIVQVKRGQFKLVE